MARRLARLSYPQLLDDLAALSARADRRRLTRSERITRLYMRREIRRRERVALIAAEILGERLD